MSDDTDAGRPRLVDLLRRIPDQISRLVRDELNAAKTEVTTKLKAAAIGIAMLAVGGVLALYALNGLLAAAILGLATVLPGWLSALIIGVLLLIVAGVLVLVGIRRLRKGAVPVPTESIKSVKADIHAVKGHLPSPRQATKIPQSTSKATHS